jgi:histidine ammonia-lyase
MAVIGKPVIQLLFVSRGLVTRFADRSAPDQAAELQEHLVRFLGNGTGAATSVSTALAAVLILANSLARGHSAVRIELIEHLVAMLNSDIVPVIPEEVQSARAATWLRCPMSAQP